MGNFFVGSEIYTNQTGPKAAAGLESLAKNQAAIRELPGAIAPVDVSITDGVISPVYAFCVVDTEGGAAADNLDVINTTLSATDALHDGMLLFLQAKDSARTVTVKNSVAANGINTVGGVDITLGTAWWLALQLRGGKWHEVQQGIPVPSSTYTTRGIIRLAVSAEATAGVIDNAAMTPLKTKQVLDALAGTIGTETDAKIATLNAKKVNYTDFTHSQQWNGWVKLPSGFIMQWGKFQSANQLNTVATFPIAFPGACVHCMVCGQHASGGWQGYATVNFFDRTSITTNCFTAIGGTAPVWATSSAMQMWYLAIGY